MHGIDAENLSKKFGNLLAVDSLTFSIREGEIFGLLGPNGSGKTTSIRMLTSLIAPTSGSARVNGYDVVKDPLKVRESVGILTENPSLYERLSAYENLDFFAQAYGISEKEDRRSRIREILDFFGLWERRNDKAGNFSKGMKQKLAIARALVHKPQIIFLDEPSSGLDPASAKEIRELIERMGKLEKRTILLSTHHLEDAERLCSRVMIISQGKKIAIGTPEELGRMTGNADMIEITIWGDAGHIAGLVREDENVISAETVSNRIRITLKNPDISTPEIVRKIVNSGGSILSVTRIKPSLEEAYLKLTGREVKA